jgi:putative transposase
MVPDPAQYSWSSYRANALGEPDALLSPHPLRLALGADDEARNAAYRHLFSNTLDKQPLADLRLALNQDQAIGNGRFHREIEAMSGQRRELRKRGRPRTQQEHQPMTDPRQSGLPL